MFILKNHEQKYSKNRKYNPEYIKCTLTLKDSFEIDVSTNAIKNQVTEAPWCLCTSLKKKVFNHALIRKKKISDIRYINANLHVHEKNMFRQIIKKCLEISEKTSKRF